MQRAHVLAAVGTGQRGAEDGDQRRKSKQQATIPRGPELKKYCFSSPFLRGPLGPGTPRQMTICT
jgi:hypothetical protein